VDNLELGHLDRLNLEGPLGFPLDVEHRAGPQAVRFADDPAVQAHRAPICDRCNARTAEPEELRDPGIHPLAVEAIGHRKHA